MQPGTLGETWLADLNAADQGNSEFSSVTFNGHPYQYRVVREPNLPTANSPEQTVTLELTLPGQETPQQYPLYTLADVQQTTEQTVTRLGTPRITAAIAHGDRLWWSLAFEQGEGSNGIATIASYDPATDQMILIQPEEIGSDQILDLAITGEAEQLTLWLGLMSRGQPTGHVPGLMAYHLDAGNLDAGTMTAYTRYNSPLVGAIPTQLAVDADKLWIGTRNGVCQVDWQTPEVSENWDCWQFIAKATLPEDEAVPVYPSLMSPTPTTSFPADSSAETIEVLWWVFTEISDPRKGRYEVRLDDGLVMTSVASVSPLISLDEVPLAGPGYWQWQGDRFVRPLDGQLASTRYDLGLGPSSNQPDRPMEDWYAMRGDLDLLEFSEASTRVRYYSGWVDDSLIVPFPTVVEQPPLDPLPPNPLLAQ